MQALLTDRYIQYAIVKEQKPGAQGSRPRVQDLNLAPCAMRLAPGLIWWR